MHSQAVSVIVTTYRSPRSLTFVLLALARQTLLPAEVLVADDGSPADTRDALADLCRALPFPVVHVWQPDEGFRAARSRNNAIHLAGSMRLAFLDQDTLPHCRWLATHMACLRPGVMCLGHVCDLPEDVVARLSPELVAAGEFETVLTPLDARELNRLQRKATCYAWLRALGMGVKAKPKLRASNMAIGRAELLAVNGFDEAYVGWGQEDDDLGRRLYMAGLRPCMLIDRALVSHIPHALRRPVDWRSGANVQRYRMALRDARCTAGLDQHPHADVQVTRFEAGRLQSAGPAP